jgi:hypothetical protein
MVFLFLQCCRTGLSMDHAAVSERDHRLIMRRLWAYPNTGYLYSVIIGFLAHRRKNEPSFRFAIWPSRVPSDFLKGKSGSGRPAWTRTTARRYGRKAVRGRGGSRSAALVRDGCPGFAKTNPALLSRFNTPKPHLRAVSDAWRGHGRDAGD